MIMMGSSSSDRESEQLNDYYAENTVFVAVGKQMKESESVLMWASKKFARKKRICILHVHQPAHLVTFFGGKFTVSKLKQRAIKAFHEIDRQKVHKLVNEYVLLLSQNGVNADRMWIEMENAEEGIVNMIVQHGIRWLVMGAAADKHYTKEMSELKSKKAIFVCERAPPSCHIWFTCKGNLIYTREGKRNDSGEDTSQPRESVVSNVPTKESEHVRLEDPDAYSSLVPPSSYSVPVAKEEEDVKVDGSPANTVSMDSDAETGETDSQTLDSDLLTEEEEEDDDEEEEKEEEDVTGHDPSENLLTMDSNDETEESKDMGLDSLIDGPGSPLRLTFRERGSILRACSVDLDCNVENHVVLSSSQNFRTSSDCVNAGKEGSELEKRKQKFSFRSSFDSALFEGKRAGKARLEAPREIQEKLERAISDAENLKQTAFQESVNRWKAEEDAMEAKKKAEGAERKYAMEMDQRKELEEALEKQRLECDRFKDEHEICRKELPIVEDQCCGLKYQIRESELTAKELEEKILSAVELLISFRRKRDQLQVERDNAVHEVETLRRVKEQRAAILSGPQFSTFSLMEIGEATCSFDPSKRIGDGKYGSIYHGILRHIEVAIRMLPNDGSHGQWRFEHKVEIVSRVRHPHIVTLIGICPEARSVVYEYLEKGSLEDHLACSGRNPSLNWQTRVRIATELCSTLIFLHTNNPPIFHGNLKPTKILLDANFTSKIGDLGIFRLIPQNQIHISRQSASLYMDPEFLETGVLTPDSDVYSFGVILLCLLTGRRASGLVRDVKCALETDDFKTVLDFSAGEWPVYEAIRLAELALRCCQRSRSHRPGLATEVWDVLEGMRSLCNAQSSCLEKRGNRRPPSHFLCPIYQEVMTDPCTAADGFTYEGDAIRGWLDSGRKTSPMTNLKLPSCDLIPNHALQHAIQEWLQRA